MSVILIMEAVSKFVLIQLETTPALVILAISYQMENSVRVYIVLVTSS